jgi:hypothetical protein
MTSESWVLSISEKFVLEVPGYSAVDEQTDAHGIIQP